MDHRPDHEPVPQESAPTRRFKALTEQQDATYPMLAPPAAAALGVEDAFDEEILAGLVNF